ncbi:MAG: AAA family ATPase, partial [Minicystis sp.]
RRRLAADRGRRGIVPGNAREPRAGSAEAPFIGRSAQLAALREALSKAEQGAAVTVLLRGRSGMGKSALMQRFLGEIRARTPQRLVLSGRCFEQESIPYKGVDGLVDDLCRHLRERPRQEIASAKAIDPMLTRLFPQLREIAGIRASTAVDDDGDPLVRPRAFAALRALIAQAAPQVPVLVVDDLQWSDLDSTALLTSLLHGPERAPLLLVTSFRAEDAETSPVLLSFFAALAAQESRVDVRRVEVGALDDHEAEALSRALLVADERSGDVFAERKVQALVAEAHGDPFLLTELTRHEPGSQQLTDTFDSRGDTAETGLPELGPLLAARIGRLPAPARRLLEVIALGGHPIAREVAARAAYGREGESEAIGAIGFLRTKRLIRSRNMDGSDELLPYHDRIRETVTRGLDADASRDHHHRLALALEASGAEAERLFFHFRGASRHEEAARYAAVAARRAHEALAFDRAARLYREALALGAKDGGLHAALADALAGAGRPREAALAYREAARAADPAAALGLRRRTAELLLGAGYVDEGLTMLRDVLHDVDIDLSSSLPRSLLGFAALRVRLRVRGLAFRERAEASVDARDLQRIDACYAAALGLLLVNPMLAAESMARHLLLALEAGEPFRVARALGLEAVFVAIRRGPGEATDRLLATALRIEQRMARPHLTGFVRLCEGQVAQVAGQFRRAHDLVVESESVLRQRCTSVALEIDMACLRRADLLWNLGDIAELARLSPALIEDARERGNRYVEMMVQLSIESLLGLVEGRPARAREAVATALERWPNTPGSMLHLREIRAQARIALYEGQGRAALAWIEEGLSAARRTGLHFVVTHTAELTMLGGLAALSIGDDAGAARYTRACARLDFPLAENMTRTLEVGLRRRAGDRDGALALLDRARISSRHHGAALYEQAMARRQGEWRRDAEGRALIEAADAWMSAQGVVEPERLTAMLLGWV